MGKPNILISCYQDSISQVIRDQPILREQNTFRLFKLRCIVVHANTIAFPISKAETRIVSRNTQLSLERTLVVEGRKDADFSLPISRCGKGTVLLASVSQIARLSKRQ